MILEKIYSFFTNSYYTSRSSVWVKVRKEHIKNNPTCAACGRNKKIEVHHIKPFHLYPELELDPDNLISLCDDPCHFIFGHLMNYRSWNINVVDDCKKYHEKIQNRP